MQSDKPTNIACPFCAAPLKPDSGWNSEKRETYDRFDCGTVPFYGEEERTRSHQCYMNEIDALKTGDDTQYGRGWQDGIEAAFAAMTEARTSWKAKHPPRRRPEARNV